MKRMLALAVLFIALFAGSTHAATLDVTLGNLSNTFSYSAGAALSPNVNLESPGLSSLALNNNSFIIDPPNTSPGNYIRPQGSIFGNNYLAVLGTGNPGLATFTLAPSQNILGLTWGSIDAYNTIVITDSRAATYVLTGATLLAQLGNPPAGKPHSQTDIRFIDAFGSIISATFSSTQNSFEVANFNEASAVPLPPALVLFGLALISLYAFARRRSIGSRR